MLLDNLSVCKNKLSTCGLAVVQSGSAEAGPPLALALVTKCKSSPDLAQGVTVKHQEVAKLEIELASASADLTAGLTDQQAAGINAASGGSGSGSGPSGSGWDAGAAAAATPPAAKQDPQPQRAADSIKVVLNTGAKVTTAPRAVPVSRTPDQREAKRAAVDSGAPAAAAAHPAGAAAPPGDVPPVQPSTGSSGGRSGQPSSARGHGRGRGSGTAKAERELAAAAAALGALGDAVALPAEANGDHNSPGASRGGGSVKGRGRGGGRGSGRGPNNDAGMFRAPRTACTCPDNSTFLHCLDSYIQTLIYDVLLTIFSATCSRGDGSLAPGCGHCCGCGGSNASPIPHSRRGPRGAFACHACVCCRVPMPERFVLPLKLLNRHANPLAAQTFCGRHVDLSRTLAHVNMLTFCWICRETTSVKIMTFCFNMFTFCYCAAGVAQHHGPHSDVCAGCGHCKAVRPR